MKSTRIVAALVPLMVAGLAGADVVTQWNAITLQAIKQARPAPAMGSTPPPPAARAMAMVHTAVYDAVNSITSTHTPYKFYEPAPSTTSKEAAAAQAAHKVLTQLFPWQAATFDAELSSTLSGIADGPDKAAGIALGSSIGQKVWNSRQGDGSAANPTYTGGTDPGDWRPTPPANATTPLFQQFATTTCWAMPSASAFRQGPPPAINSEEYRIAFDEVKRLGGVNSVERTAEQSDIARLWAAGGGTITPPGMWNKIAQDLAVSQGNTLEENARMFALLNIAAADAAICSWDMKVHYDFWRPVTAIELAETDGNPDTSTEAGWLPLLTTPNFQAYTSGHSTFSGAASQVLALFFGTDAINFSVTGDDVAITRNFTSLSAAADEAGRSRIYGGIHFEFDNVAGLSSGRSVGDYVFRNFLAVPTPGVVTLAGLAGLAGMRRRRGA
jgi:hypothetical protein